MAVPGCPLPAFCTASAASSLTVSTARTSTSVHPARVAIGAASDASRLLLVVPWTRSLALRSVTDRAYPEQHRLGRPHDRARTRNVVRLHLPSGRLGLVGFCVPSTTHLTGLPPHSVTPPTRMPVTAVEPRSDPVSNGLGHPRGRRTVVDYVALTKPRIIELLLVTTFPTMFLAQRGLPPLWLILATLVGGTLSAASANVLNCYLARDIE